MFGRIDHVGLAVSDLEEAIDLHVNVYGLALVHRETVESQGVEAALLDVGENHASCSPRSMTTRRSASSSPSAARGCTTSPTRSTTSRPSCGGCATRECA